MRSRAGPGACLKLHRWNIVNLEDLDEDVPLDVATEPRPLAKRDSEPMAVLNNALGFGGHNVSLVFTAA